MFYTYRLHVDFTSAEGMRLHKCRGVDTFVEAEEVAKLGHEFDAEDGTTTVYTLQVWENGTDRSVLRQSVVLP